MCLFIVRIVISVLGMRKLLNDAAWLPHRLLPNPEWEVLHVLARKAHRLSDCADAQRYLASDGQL